MKKLFEVARQEGLAIEENAPLPEGFYGLYYSEENYNPVAILSKEIFGKRRLERVVLAEEIGHHLTTTCHCLPCYFEDYSHRLTISRQEYRALRKGAQILISPEEILDAISHGIEEPADLADYFEVTETFILLRLKVWEISGK